MTRTVKGTKYRKWKTDDHAPRSNSQYGRGRPGSAGKTHLQFWEKSEKRWRFVCGKRTDESMFARVSGQVIDDEMPITCLNCVKHAPDVVDKMDTIPDLEEFQ